MHYLGSRGPGTLRLCFGTPGCCSALQSAPLTRESPLMTSCAAHEALAAPAAPAASSRSGLSGRPGARGGGCEWGGEPKN